MVSQLKSYPATCTQCGNRFQARLWSSINVTLHPQLEALLLSGRLNLATCPRCSTTAQTEPPLLYHDMEAPRAILALSAEDRGRAEETKQALKAEFEETKRSLGGEEVPGMHVFEPQVVFGYGALMQAIWPEAVPAPAPAPTAAPPSEAASVEARRERLRTFTPEDVRRLTRGLDLVSQAVITAQTRAPVLQWRAGGVLQALARRWFESAQRAGPLATVYQWLGNAYFYGWLDARALWQRQYADSGQRPSTYLDWLPEQASAAVEGLVVNEAPAHAEVQAAQESPALKDWHASRLEIQFRSLARADRAVPREDLRPVFSDVVHLAKSGSFAVSGDGDVRTVVMVLALYAGWEKVGERAYSDGFVEGILVENFLAEAGLPPQATQAPAPAEPRLPPKPIPEMTVQEYLEYEISRRTQAGATEISAGAPQDLLTASRQKERTVTCAHCGHKSSLRLWSAVNIATHSHLRGILREGKIHRFRCAGCGNYGEAESVFQYYDPSGPLLVQVYAKRCEDIRNTVVSEFETVLAYIQGLPPEARPKDYPADAVVLFGMEDLADFLRAREPEPPPQVTGGFDGEGLMALSRETFEATAANLDSSVQAWREVLASSGPLQRLRQHRVWYVVRGAHERVQSTQPEEAAVEKVGLAVGAVWFLGFGDGRHLYHYEWTRRGQPPAGPGSWLAAFTDPEIVHAVHKDESDEGDEAWGKALGSASTVQAWQHDFLASQAVREAVRRVSETTSRAESGQAMTQIAEQAYDRSLVLAMLLVAWLRGA